MTRKQKPFVPPRFGQCGTRGCERRLLPRDQFQYDRKGHLLCRVHWLEYAKKNRIYEPSVRREASA